MFAMLGEWVQGHSAELLGLVVAAPGFGTDIASFFIFPDRKADIEYAGHVVHDPAIARWFTIAVEGPGDAGEGVGCGGRSVEYGRENRDEPIRSLRH